MPLIKRTVTPARLAANRRNAAKSTGPRTARGKARSSLNALRRGRRSKTIRLVWRIIMEAPPCGVIRMARELMTPAQLSQPDVADMLNAHLAPGDISIESDPDHGNPRRIPFPDLLEECRQLQMRRWRRARRERARRLRQRRSKPVSHAISMTASKFVQTKP